MILEIEIKEILNKHMKNHIKRKEGIMNINLKNV